MWASRCGSFSGCGVWALGHAGSSGCAYGLSCSRHAESSLTRYRTRISCIGRQLLNPWTTREVLSNTSAWLNGEVEACASGVPGGKMWGGRLSHGDVGCSLSHLWDPSDFLVGTLRGCLSTFRRSPSLPSPWVFYSQFPVFQEA